MQTLLRVLLALFIFTLSPMQAVEESAKTLIEMSAEEKNLDNDPSDGFYGNYKFFVYPPTLTNSTIFTISTPKSFAYQNSILRPPIYS